MGKITGSPTVERLGTPSQAVRKSRFNRQDRRSLLRIEWERRDKRLDLILRRGERCLPEWQREALKLKRNKAKRKRILQRKVNAARKREIKARAREIRESAQALKAQSLYLFDQRHRQDELIPWKVYGLDIVQVGDNHWQALIGVHRMSTYGEMDERVLPIDAYTREQAEVLGKQQVKYLRSQY